MMKHFAGSQASRGTYLAARRGVLCEKRCPGLYRRELCSGLVPRGDLSSAGPCDAPHSSFGGDRTRAPGGRWGHRHETALIREFLFKANRDCLFLRNPRRMLLLCVTAIWRPIKRLENKHGNHILIYRPLAEIY